MKNVTILTDAGIDYNEGVERFSGYSEMYEKYLQKSLEDPEYSKLCDAMESGDTDTAFRSAHTIKGMVGNLSINKFFEDIKPFVELLRSGNMEDAKVMFPKIKESYEDSVKAINKYFE